ncbi:MAG: hypothetical protein NTU85_00330 [Candidatus Kaiserbacteria bacterium]|nr:hypothetical protein [Candidatus Kaiserbacteria bacterium]
MPKSPEMNISNTVRYTNENEGKKIGNEIIYCDVPDGLKVEKHQKSGQFN